MRNLLILLGFSVAVAATPALGQQVSHIPGGDGNGTQNSDSYNNGSATDQLLREQSLNNLPREQGNRLSHKADPARPAKPGELNLGATVNDKTGVPVATILSIDPDGIVLAVGNSKVKVPADAFGHNSGGLLIDMTKAQFEQVVAQANAAS